ncbi:hypothetical protein RJ640_011098 [Escallonia rubra]|uniref:Methyltransferase type 11 domain-containing protein n=1 Tax=Escallonia rubra TaxID=112253 RepID=A0AA88UGF7_9ASTE|nr:hypothetical protein RJ640_011098 [Escallonia rubra]
MAYSSSLFSPVCFNPNPNSKASPLSHKPTRKTLTPLSTTTEVVAAAAPFDAATLLIIGGGSIAVVLSLSDLEKWHQVQADEVSGGDKEVVIEYFNNNGFQRWRKIYDETDEVNRVQMDIQIGHSKTVENVIQMLTDEGPLEGVTVCDAGCGTDCLLIPLAKQGAVVLASDISAAMVAEAEKQVSSSPLPTNLTVFDNVVRTW